MTLQDLIDEALRLRDQGADPGAKVCVEVEYDAVRRASKKEKDPDESAAEFAAERLERDTSGSTYGIRIVLER